MIIIGDALTELSKLPSESVDCCVTSPPYWGLRDYGHDDQLGLEKTPEEYVEKMVMVFREVRRVLKPEATLWLNLGDSYVSAKGRYSSCAQTISNGLRGEPVDSNRPDQKGHEYLKDKDLCGIPWRVAFALQKDGWWLRQDIIWHKPNPMPESVTDRCTKSHEYIFLMSKSATYYYDANAIKERATWAEQSGDDRPAGIVRDRVYGYESKQLQIRKRSSTFKQASKTGNAGNGDELIINDGFRNKRSVWTVPTKPYAGAHFAVYPEELIYPCILAGCPKGGVVLDPFAGSGTTGYVARKHGRDFILIELNESYLNLINARLAQGVLI